MINANVIYAKAVNALGIAAHGIKMSGDALWKWVYDNMFDSDSEQLLDSDGEILMCKSCKEKK